MVLCKDLAFKAVRCNVSTKAVPSIHFSIVFNTAVDSLCQYKIYITSVFLNILPRRRNLFALKFDPMRYPKIDIFDPLIFIVLEGLSHDSPKLEDSPPSNPKVPVNVRIFHSGNNANTNARCKC